MSAKMDYEDSMSYQAPVIAAQPHESDSPAPQYIAAVDLGSNSFHMLLTRYEQGRFVHVARAKQMVQLARGLDAEGKLCKQAQARAMNCLDDFRKILNQYPQTHIAAAATKVLRMASDSEAFLVAAQQRLGAPIELISGEQEALLVYKGMAHHLSDQPSRRLVIDIGGASTELIVGTEDQAQQLKSLDLGCVTSAETFFHGSRRIEREQFNACLKATCEQLHTIKASFAPFQWDICAGASGTLRVIAELIGDTSDQPVISRHALDQLIEEMLTSGQLSEQIPENLRHDVLPAGLAILKALFSVFNIERMLVAAASLKEGLLLQAIQR
jgi:exopolyphosphatase/guanosine-5'-triphosphate,3'-diphosphate pyrophosphatase